MLKRIIKSVLIKNVSKSRIAQKDKIMDNKSILNLMLQNGRIWSKLIETQTAVNSLHDVEFKVFSQWGDDGIIQYLINYLEIENKTFVEFGVEDYSESNTRFLLMNNNWTGLVIDGSEHHINNLKKNEIFWKYDLIAKSAFITVENINSLIETENIKGQIGLLHIDIDGNDYWIWRALTVVQPIIMIVEYNSVFGCDRAITIPYESNFVRTNAHYSNLYAGASILALCDLAEEKGYAFVGSNSAGNNAYFIKKEFCKDLKVLSPQEGYVLSKFRESRDKDGELNYLRDIKRLESIKGLPVFNTKTKIIEDL